MAFEHEKQQAAYLLRGIENGTLNATEASHLVEQSDPALVYLLITWLRTAYGGAHPASDGVLGRLVEIKAALSGKMQEGKLDPITVWFEDEYSYRDFSSDAFIDLVVDKLES